MNKKISVNEINPVVERLFYRRNRLMNFAEKSTLIGKSLRAYSLAYILHGRMMELHDQQFIKSIQQNERI